MRITVFAVAQVCYSFISVTLDLRKGVVQKMSAKDIRMVSMVDWHDRPLCSIDREN